MSSNKAAFGLNKKYKIKNKHINDYEERKDLFWRDYRNTRLF